MPNAKSSQTPQQLPIDGDTIIILSPDTIQTIVQAWFNDLFTRSVTIVDTAPSDTGYAFTLTFSHTRTQTPLQGQKPTPIASTTQPSPRKETSNV